MSQTELIKIDQLNINFGENRVISDVSLSLKRGEITTLIGPNGAGKTTLVKAVLGLLNPSSGTITRNEALRIGYMPQKLHIDTTFPLTVERFLKTAAFSGTDDQLDALRSVKAETLLKQSVHSLSGGEMQRVLLARALLRKPELLVLDEPAQGVDINGQVELYNLIARIRDQYNCAVLMISHDLHLVMAATDQVICLNRHICCSGHPEQVSSDPSYIELFGVPGSENLALYSHHHNHQHNEHGDIVPLAEDQHSNCGGHH
ncbi:zinc ABC transporter ATP-binding protein ZnuC [Amphritea balenae]|uniref:Zinc ABC transporter ATP-binding protein ZnuC n=1 Tax=Amphritea balenae TaxID=452629 RepID=A0A3P1SP17_9GAMM|nr:zinc ABC transporter ATP-binding protein ZnuC [Amphritea balenae]RRC98877.1 zinc ABC transporter ATP-binding protein ZnuC [Amphritea balenae]GGK62496.1 zinc import ATP-binding protein ZnuC [Amphritea balenae]